MAAVFMRVVVPGRCSGLYGTWTEHPDEDGLWATYDLGVVEVP